MMKQYWFKFFVVTLLAFCFPFDFQISDSFVVSTSSVSEARGKRRMRRKMRRRGRRKMRRMKRRGRRMMRKGFKRGRRKIMRFKKRHGKRFVKNRRFKKVIRQPIYRPAPIRVFRPSINYGGFVRPEAQSFQTLETLTITGGIPVANGFSQVNSFRNFGLNPFGGLGVNSQFRGFNSGLGLRRVVLPTQNFGRFNAFNRPLNPFVGSSFRPVSISNPGFGNQTTSFTNNNVLSPSSGSVGNLSPVPNRPLFF